ncbi:MAG: nitroreductase [Euryarchaeota archaeon]|nr:nitroreductase [Euryarchaeota archaeon]
MDVVDAIAVRRAYRAFSDRPVERKNIIALAKAMCLAPSCNNNQPWRVIICCKDSLQRVKEALDLGNVWATAAPLIMVLASKPSLDCRLNDGRDYYQFSCGLAVGQMILRASELGLIAHPIAGYDPCKIKDACGIPEDNVIITLIVCGYPGEDISLLSDDQIAQQKERPKRLPLGDTLFFEEWEEPYISSD